MLAWLFKMQAFVQSGCEKWAKESGKQNSFISVPQFIFFGVMPLICLGCFLLRSAIHSSFYQLEVTSLRHWDNELITDWLLFSSSLRKKKIPYHLHVRVEPVIFWISLDFLFSWHRRRERLLINVWNGAELSLTASLPRSLPPLPFCPLLYQGSSVALTGLVSGCWFITAQVGGN